MYIQATTTFLSKQYLGVYEQATLRQLGPCCLTTDHLISHLVNFLVWNIKTNMMFSLLSMTSFQNDPGKLIQFDSPGMFLQGRFSTTIYESGWFPKSYPKWLVAVLQCYSIWNASDNVSVVFSIDLSPLLDKSRDFIGLALKNATFTWAWKPSKNITEMAKT